jgi:antitoxin component YwqK of YwqJK toxin-antitoxin module
VKVYYESGSLKYETPYVNGVKHGVLKVYDEDKAIIVCLALYDNGKYVTSAEFDTKGGQSWLNIVP